MIATNRTNGLWAKILIALVITALVGSFVAIAAPVQAKGQATVHAKWCGALSAYTTWDGYKPILYVWKGGAGKPNPTAVSVWFSGQSVPNADYGIMTSAPQVDRNNGWVGYHLSTRWYWSHPLWDVDRLWEVRGCLY